MTVPELKKELEMMNIPYNPTAKKPELEALLKGAEIIGIEQMSETDYAINKIKEARQQLIEAYTQYGALDRNKSPRLRQAISLVNQSFEVCKFQ